MIWETSVLRYLGVRMWYCRISGNHIRYRRGGSSVYLAIRFQFIYGLWKPMAVLFLLALQNGGEREISR